MKIENVDCIDKMIRMMTAPVFKIQGKNSKATIGRIYHRGPAFQVRLNARMVKEEFDTTADALAFVTEKTGRQVVAV